jgi:hypothetical protein
VPNMDVELESMKKEMELNLLKSRIHTKMSEKDRLVLYVKINALEGRIPPFSEKTEELIDEYLRLKHNFNLGLRGQEYIEYSKKYNDIKLQLNL